MIDKIKELPNDLQHKIYNDVLSLRKPIKVNTKLLDDIRASFQLKVLIKEYIKYFGEGENKYLHWLENNLLCYINGYVPLLFNTNTRFYSILPEKNHIQIQEYLFHGSDDEQTLKRRIRLFWLALCCEEQIDISL